jgi:hypothetical protein
MKYGKFSRQGAGRSLADAQALNLKVKK